MTIFCSSSSPSKNDNYYETITKRLVKNKAKPLSYFSKLKHLNFLQKNKQLILRRSYKKKN